MGDGPVGRQLPGPTPEGGWPRLRSVAGRTEGGDKAQWYLIGLEGTRGEVRDDAEVPALCSWLRRGWMGPSALIGKCWGSRRKLQEQDHELSFNLLSLRALLHIQNRELMKGRSSGLEAIWPWNA